MQWCFQGIIKDRDMEFNRFERKIYETTEIVELKKNHPLFKELGGSRMSKVFQAVPENTISASTKFTWMDSTLMKNQEK